MLTARRVFLYTAAAAIPGGAILKAAMGFSLLKLAFNTAARAVPENAAKAFRPVVQLAKGVTVAAAVGVPTLHGIVAYNEHGNGPQAVRDGAGFAYRNMLAPAFRGLHYVGRESSELLAKGADLALRAVVPNAQTYHEIKAYTFPDARLAAGQLIDHYSAQLVEGIEKTLSTPAPKIDVK